MGLNALSSIPRISITDRDDGNGIDVPLINWFKNLNIDSVTIERVS